MVENNELREYIYVDNVAMNSLLAQFDEGLSMLMVRTTGQNKQTRLGTVRGGEETVGVSGGVPGIAKGSGSTAHSHNKSTEESTEELNQSAESVVNGDFGIEILEDYLQRQIKRPEDAMVGDIVKFYEEFRLYDFESLTSGMDPNLIGQVMQFGETPSDDESTLKELKKKIQILKSQSKKNPAIKAQLLPAEAKLEEAEQSLAASRAAERNFKIMHTITEYFSKVLPDSIIISTPNTVSFANKDLFRLSVAQLQMLQKNPRSLHVLGIVENRSDNVDWEKQKLQMKDLPVSEMGSISTYMTSIALSNFGISQKENSLQVRPIAMYF